MKHSYILTGIKFSMLTHMLKNNGGFSPSKINRFLFLFQNSLFSEFLNTREKKVFHKDIIKTKLPENPIFIIGHWRTGSTYLHQLITQDPEFCFTSLFQCSQPDHFLYSKRFFEPVMSRLLGKTRPMDNVKIGVDEPQEDEYAILKLVSGTPMEKLIFSENEDYFLKNVKEFTPSGDNLNIFDQKYSYFLQKIMLENPGKNFVSKNPLHSFRLDYLLNKFPHAKFIHIYRHPYDVIPSTIRLWNIVGKQNILKGKWKSPSLTDVAKYYLKFIDHIDNKLKSLPDHQYLKIKFEELEKFPLATVKQLYKHFSLTLSKEFEEKLNQFIDEVRDYKKNKFILSEKDKKDIYSQMSLFMNNKNYN